MQVLGKERCRRRIRNTIAHLKVIAEKQAAENKAAAADKKAGEAAAAKS